MEFFRFPFPFPFSGIGWVFSFHLIMHIFNSISYIIPLSNFEIKSFWGEKDKAEDEQVRG